MTERKWLSLFLFVYAAIQITFGFLWFYHVISVTSTILMFIGSFIIVPLALKFYPLDK